MARPFEVKPVRRVGKNGAVEIIGMEWTEEASWRSSQGPMMWLLAVPLAIGLIIAGVVFIGAAGNPLFMLLAVAFSIWLGHRMFAGLPRRSVLLDRDGRIQVPDGMPGNGSARFLKVRQGELAGFEIGPCFSGMAQDWTSSLQAVTTSGITVTVSRFLHREEARQIAVGLNLALHEMRKSAGATPTRTTARALTLVD